MEKKYLFVVLSCLFILNLYSVSGASTVGSNEDQTLNETPEGGSKCKGNKTDCQDNGATIVEEPMSNLVEEEKKVELGNTVESENITSETTTDNSIENATITVFNASIEINETDHDNFTDLIMNDQENSTQYQNLSDDNETNITTLIPLTLNETYIEITTVNSTEENSFLTENSTEQEVATEDSFLTMNSTEQEVTTENLFLTANSTEHEITTEDLLLSVNNTEHEITTEESFLTVNNTEHQVTTEESFLTVNTTEHEETTIKEEERDTTQMQDVSNTTEAAENATDITVYAGIITTTELMEETTQGNSSTSNISSTSNASTDTTNSSSSSNSTEENVSSSNMTSSTAEGTSEDIQDLTPASHTKTEEDTDNQLKLFIPIGVVGILVLVGFIAYFLVRKMKKTATYECDPNS